MKVIAIALVGGLLLTGCNSPYKDCVAKGKAWYAKNNAQQYDRLVEQRCSNNSNAFGQ